MKFVGKPSILEGFNKFRETMSILYPHYDLSGAEYIDRSTKIKIRCKIPHYVFYIEPRFILKGRGVCPECSKRIKNNLPLDYVGDIRNKRSDSTESFIHKSKKIFEDRFDYSEVDYLGKQHSKVTLVCKEHKYKFEITANNHLNSKHGGCSKCVKDGFSQILRESRGCSPRKYTTKDFIKKAEEVHNNKYDYTFSIYENAKSKVLIVCPIHGGFRITAGAHLFGAGCHKCQNTYPLSNEEFIEECRKVHKDTYILDHIDYVNISGKIKVECKEHGIWTPTAGNFKKGSGCPFCGHTTNRYTNKPTTLYYIKYKDTYKVGITTKSVEDRYVGKDITKEEYTKLSILFEQKFNNGHIPFKIEQKIRSKYKGYTFKGENIFKLTGNTEVFSEDVLGIESNDKIRLGWFNNLINEQNNEPI